VAAADAASNGADPVETAANLGVFVKEMLPYGGVGVDRVAAHLRMSTRTLQRRLRDLGFSFEEIVDDVRRVEAIRLVATGDGSAIEMAFMLGYSDQAHFSRAFRALDEHGAMRLCETDMSQPACISLTASSRSKR
jgi:AraC-like DNA-binding protein